MAKISSETDFSSIHLEHILLYHLVTKDNKSELLTKCFPALFFDEKNKGMFKIIQDYHGGADIFTVAARMHELYGMPSSQVSDMFFDRDFSYIADNAPFESVLRRLKELLFKRLAFQRLERMSNIVESGKADPADEQNGNLYDEASKLLLAENRLLRRERNTVEKIAAITADRINNPSDIVRTSFEFIDRRTGGLTRRAISSLLAMPGHMKSTFTDALMYSALRTSNEVGLIISLEDPIEERVKRIVANRLDVSLADMRFKRVNVPQSEILQILKIELGGRLHLIDTRDLSTPEEAATAINDIKPNIAVVDHIQNFNMKGEMVSGLINAATVIEVAAMRNNSHVLITSQVNDKRLATRDDPSPEAADVQWTSALRQKSAEMFSLFYQYQISRNFVQQNLLQFKILKSRYANAVSNMILKIDADKGRIISETSAGGINV